MEKLTITWTGTAGLMLHNSQWSVNPISPLSKAIKPLTSKRKKTDVDYESISKLEWVGGFYYKDSKFPVVEVNDKGEVIFVDNEVFVMPSFCIEAVIRESAKKSRKGKDAIAGVLVLDDPLIQYDGPRKLKEMWESGEFADTRNVKIQRASIVRCRPIFREWAIAFEMCYSPELFNKSEIISILKLAGEMIGLCEYRPRFGRFNVTVD